MAVPDVLRPLIAAGLTTTIRADGRLVVRPLERITVVIDAHIRAHRDGLVAALSVHVPARSPLGWPPPEPEWFGAWMAKDDERRRATMAAAMQRKAARSRSTR
jgi:hypothetical protein